MTIPGPPRLKALTDEELPEEILNNKDLNKVNIIRTLAHHPKMFKPWNRFAAYVIARSELSPRQREILFLRTGWNHQSDYEFGQHRAIGKRAGLTDDEILSIAKGPDEPNWAEDERALLLAADDLFRDSDISDANWELLSKHFNTQQLLDVVIGVGQYTLVSMALKTLRVELEDGVEGLPIL
jgi:alkylhydroperoxidase family enzyme